MIRRPLWNRGGGVFVEEPTWVPAPADAATDGTAPTPPGPAADEPIRPAVATLGAAPPEPAADQPAAAGDGKPARRGAASPGAPLPRGRD